MLTWFLVNVVISVLALVFITLSTNAPHRLRFLAGFAALVAWLIPWPLLPDLLPANMFSFELERIERAVEAGSTRLTDVFPVIVEAGAVPLASPLIVLTVMQLCFIALTLIGCVLFAWKATAHQLLLRQLARQGADGNWLWTRAGLTPVCPVGIQREIAGAFSSGLLQPRIWVHGDLVHSPQLATLLRHEVTHILQHDNWYLLIITLVERLCWWNPLSWYLGRVTRELQELSCDERCLHSNSDYPVQLAQLMIDSARSGQQSTVLALGANIFNTPNPNVKRIQLLQRSYPMLTRHMLGAAVTAATALLAVGVVTAQPDTEQAVAGERVQAFRLERAPDWADAVPFVNGEQRVPRYGMISPCRQRGGFGQTCFSFNFTDAPLPNALMLFVGSVSGRRPASAGVAVVRKLDEDADTTHELSTDQLIESIEAAGGAASWREENRVVSFSPRLVVNDNLVLEYAEAADKTFTVSFENLTLAEAIVAIADASRCNIFQEGDTIVVDYCD